MQRVDGENMNLKIISIYYYIKKTEDILIISYIIMPYGISKTN